MKNKMTKDDWIKVIQRKITDNGLNRYSGYSAKELEKEFNRISKILYSIFNSSDLKFRGKYRTTDIYAEAQRLMLDVETSTRPFFTDDLTFKSPVEFEKLYVLERLDRMAHKYSEIKELLQMYSDGNISLDELNKRIAKFKETNEEYMKQKY